MEKLCALIVDDDKNIRELLAEFLEQHDFIVCQAANTAQADQIIAQQQIDVMLLDLKMPQEDGLTFCRRIRNDFQQPIIMLTAVDSEIEQIVAHEVGVDDYLTKPYNMRILLAKIKSALRRYQVNIEKLLELNSEAIKYIGLSYQFANWNLNTQTRLLTTPDKIIVTLSSGEYNLLLTFIEHPNRVLSREQLLDYTQAENDSFDRSIDVVISRLRNKIKDSQRTEKMIKTIRDGGYMFMPKVVKNEVKLKQ